MKKSRIVSVLLGLLLVLALPLQQASAASSFKDIPADYWAADVIEQFVDEGLMSGFEDATFRPNQNVSRQQAAIILVKALDLEVDSVATSQFTDVKANHPYAAYFEAASKAGLMTGSNGEFNPDEPLTRAQLATIFVKAFDLEGNGTTAFKDVPKNSYAYEVIDALYANNITSGYADNTFKPSATTTRAHFVAMLSKALEQNGQSSEDITELLREVYENEFNLDSYEFEGSIDLGLVLPETEDLEPEVGFILETLKDIQIDITGAYKKDPMQLEAVIDLTLKGDIQTTFSMPMVMTEEKMWVKLPESPLLPLPAEVKGKFIEFDLLELAELSGQSAASLDYDLQAEMNQHFINLVVSALGKDFYKEVDPSSVTLPAGIEADKVIKFEITNETLKPFINTVINDLLPKFIELLGNPEYVEALGLTAEDVQLLKEGFATEDINLDEVVAEISKFLKINQLDEIIVLTEDNYISYDAGTLDFTVTVENEGAFNFKLSFIQSKSNVNKDFDFSIGIPTGENVLPFDELLQLEEEALTN
nr:S-layer homology domain-containing protein [Lysinibacillus timonensis]